MHAQLANRLLKDRDRRVSFTEGTGLYTTRPTTSHHANLDAVLEPPDRDAEAEADDLSSRVAMKYILKKNASNLQLAPKLNSSDSGLKTLKQLKIERLESENCKMPVPQTPPNEHRAKRNSYFNKF